VDQPALDPQVERRGGEFMGSSDNPRHDRVRLTADERAILADLERQLEAEGANAHGWGTRPTSTLGSVAQQFGRIGVRIAPWVALISALTMPIAMAASPYAGAFVALLLTGALTTWLMSSWLRLAHRAPSSPRRGSGNRAEDAGDAGG
jgi:hypothetical protein